MLFQESMASLKLNTESSVVSLPSSSRKFIDDIPPDRRSKLCTEIDYTIHRNEGYWQKLIGRLGFDETHSKKFRLSFEMHGSPTDNLLRDCSYRMLRIRHLYQILTEIGLPNLAEAYLKDYDTEEPLPPFPPSFAMTSRSSSHFADTLNGGNDFRSTKGSWPGIDTFHFSFDQIKSGTCNFSPKMELGAGAFGKVYKVILNNTLFACKVLKIDKENQLTTSLLETHRQHDDLRNELNYLAEYRHPNVIALYGWSLDGPDPCLIYDYMKNGSLQDRLQCLNGSKPMDWEIRLKVSCGAARGLQFLHTKNSKPLIHGDIKTANILLDNSFTAKLGDFGLARELPQNAATGSYIRLGNEHTPGTLGYLANEYIITKKLSVQVDTYAFGVVLLELYTGRRAYDRTKATPLLRDYMDEVANDVSKIGQAKTNEKLLRLLDPRIPPLIEEAALKFVRLALSCCHEKRKERPKMAVALAELNDIDRTVAVASGREPEESLPSFDPNAVNPVDGKDDAVTNTLQRRIWLLQHSSKSAAVESDLPNLSKDPVESVDNSSQMKDQGKKADDLKPGTSAKGAATSVEKKLGKLSLSSSDDSDSQGRWSAETTNSGLYIVQRPDHAPHIYPPGPSSNQPQPSYLPGSVQQHPSPSYLPHGYVGGVTNVRLGEHQGTDLLYPPGSYCPARAGIIENPFNLDLSKVPRPPCYCGTCSQQQQNPSPLPSQPSQWPTMSGQCSPAPFTSVDFKGPSYSKYSGFYPSKPSARGEPSHNGFLRPGPNSKYPLEPPDHGEMSFDSSISSIPHQLNSFSFNPSSALGSSDLDDSDDGILSQPPLSINPVKESLLEQLKDGKNYTQIFPDVKRVPTEGTSEDDV